MNTVKSVLVGTVSGALMGLLVLLTAVVMTNALLQRSLPVGQLVLVLLVSGGLVGSLNSALCNVVDNRERLLLGLLLATAVAATSVLMGWVTPSGLLPPLVYALSAATGVVVTPVACLLGRAVQLQPNALSELGTSV